MHEQIAELVPVRPECGTFREAMSAIVGPVTIITARDEQGEAYGFTASSVVSLSEDPPLLVVCVDRSGRSHDRLVAAQTFCVNVIGVDGRDLALRFGSKRVDRFAGVEVEDLDSGTPSLPVAMARILCRAYGLRDGGDHTIVLGQVTGYVRRGTDPLACWNHDFVAVRRV